MTENRWKLTDEEKQQRHKICPKCGSENLNPAGGWNSANGWIKCYDCGHGPFWWLKIDEKMPMTIAWPNTGRREERDHRKMPELG